MRELGREVVAADATLTLIGSADLDDLVARARANERRRARILMHGDPSAALHEMVIVMTRGQYVPPHRNDRSAKSYVLFRGSFAFVRFTDDGRIEGSIRLEAGSPSAAFMARLEHACWHMVIPISPEVVFLETILGPHRSTRFADWAPPADGSANALAFFQRVCAKCGV